MSTKISIRLPDDVLQELTEQAAKENRTVSQMIIMRLRGSGEKTELAKVAVMRRLGNIDRPRHDPATCRIYKCGMCAAMKEK